MRKIILAALTISAMTVAAPSAAQVTTYNSDVTGGFQYGSGNDYNPANATVLTDGDNELAVRWHEYQQVAPASTDGLYTFDLGTVLSFDFSIGGDTSGSNLLLTNLLTSQTVSYDPLCPLGPGLCAFNDNEVSGDGDIQNSQRLTFSQFAGLGFDANTNNTYRIDLTAGGNTVTSFAQLGSGAVAAVPEPATWAMMLLGFGAVGGSIRRRRRAQGRLQLA
jgi:hypothetical protein